MFEMRGALAAIALCALAACGAPHDKAAADESAAAVMSEDKAALDSAGERFVLLALRLGAHDPNFVDAYYGPAELKTRAESEPQSLAELKDEAEAIHVMLDDMTAQSPRAVALKKSVDAALFRIKMAQGETFPFETEAEALYDVAPPPYDLADFNAALAEIDAMLPGEGALEDRVDAFRNSLAIPREKLQSVMEAAIAECRKRTLAHLTLPENETFELAFVNDKPWSGYNWYQGGYKSRIEVNTDLPVVIDRAVGLGCHEGYPGHHVWNMLVERDLVRGEGRIEDTLYPLFSPSSLIGEGSANYGVDLAFPDGEQLAFEKETLYPLAGLDASKADLLDRLNKARRKLSHAGNHVAREYLDGRLGRDDAIALLQKYDLSNRARAEQRLKFIETYRAYVVNYNLGRDIVEDYVSKTAKSPDDRWRVFEEMLKSGKTAGDLKAAIE